VKYTHLYTGPDGLSHFEDVDVPEASPLTMAAESIIFRTAQAGNASDWHTAPRSQFLITLSGVAEIVTSGGETRQFTNGAIMLADDRTGKGHTTRVVGPEPRVYLTVPLKQ